MKNFTLFTGIAFVVVSLPSVAEHHFRQHDSHQHGVVTWHIAQSDDEVLIEISAPGSDVVGFEHPPKNAEQEKQIRDALALFAKPADLLVLNLEANCHMGEQKASQSLGKLDSHAGHDPHDDHKDHNHAKHDSDEHDEHEDHDHHDHAANNEKASHGEFSVKYTFHCESPNKLVYFHTAWFTQFNNTKKIKVEAITDKGIKAATLDASMEKFNF